MKIPFDIKFRPQIESGEYKVETRDGRDARIICWDSKAKDARFDIRPIIALVTTPIPELESLIQCGENGILYKDAKDRCDLFIVTPEPELSEFEKKLSDVVGYAISLSVAEPKKPTSEFVKEYASELLSLAREELFANDTVLKEYAEVSREQGKAEALKELPRWRKWKNGACGNGRGIPLAIVKRGLNGYELVDALGIQGEQYIMLSDLEKLPGFKED